MQESIPKKIDINEPIVWFDFIANFRLQLFFTTNFTAYGYFTVFLSQNLAFIIIYYYHQRGVITTNFTAYGFFLLSLCLINTKSIARPFRIRSMG